MQKAFSRGNCLLVLALSGLICMSGQAQTILVTPIHSFNSHFATEPISLFIGKPDSTLYGVTYRDQTNGTIFTMKTDGSGYTVLHTFSSAEEVVPGSSYVPGEGYAVPGIVQGHDQMLYGTTPAGGTNNAGTFFRLNPNGTGYTVLYNFDNANSVPGNLIQGSDGAFYGAGNSIFKIDANGSNFTVLHHFANDTDGTAPQGLIQGRDGMLYGTAFFGGANTLGTVFSIDTNGINFNVLHSFAMQEGSGPSASLIQGSDGALYGTTSGDGGSVTNTIFKVNTNGDNFTVLHRFTGPPNDGFTPLGALVEDANQVLYGTTWFGGSNQGSIFKIGLDGNGYASLYFFTNGTSLGVKPITGLVRDPGNAGVFYGTTYGELNPVTGSIFAALINPPAAITPVVSQTGSNQAVVFWPKWAGTYRLQSTTNIASGNWTSVTDSVPVFGAQVTTTNPAVFYRLVSP